ncbi:hypothetical protein V1525DRAFT_410832 [Lipomyces kononenkoae]|uniref:Uncharacterized protein n=1 Tax=Lipomyces kononenkoae TaxID=34357 RepID=A0ACC3SU19_LIPKO
MMSNYAISFRRALWLMAALAFVTVTIVSLSYSNVIESDYVPFRRPTSVSGPKTSSEGGLTEEMIRESVIQQYEVTKKLVASGSPLEELSVCSNPLHTNESAVVLVSENGPEGTLARIEFAWFGFNTPARYNPNILPYPSGSPYPYFGIAQQAIDVGLPAKHHELVYCDMDWGLSRGIGRRILKCQTGLQKIEFPEWRSPNGSCAWLPLLEGTNGPMDPRVFFSPLGEPLMIVGTNGISNCMSQYIIDLRAMIPDLADKMKIGHVPIRFRQLTELPRDHYDEIEKNWFLIYNDNDLGYVQHAIENRSMSALDHVDAVHRNNIVNLVEGETAPKCVTSLKKEYEENNDQIRNDIHQGTNTLRVTLCEFPCIPTIHNTVLIEMFQIKYHSYLEVFYRRYVMIMNVTAPFEIIGRTNNLIYAGSDEKMLIFTVSMAWDHASFRRHEPWNESKYGGRAIWDALEDQEAEEYENSIKDFTGQVRDDPQQQGRGKSQSSAEPTSPAPVEMAAVNNPDDAADKEASKYPFLANIPMNRNSTYNNPLANEYYHGWIDDTIILNIGINDMDSGIVHVKARDLLQCMTACK